MKKVLDESLESAFPCDQTTEYDNRIEEEIEIEQEYEEEEEDLQSVRKREQVEQQFARYERSYRARRIREMTRMPIRTNRERQDKLAA